LKTCQLNSIDLSEVTGGANNSIFLGILMGAGLGLCALGTLGIVDSFKNPPVNKHKRRAKYICSILSVVIGCLVVGTFLKTLPANLSSRTTSTVE